MTDTDEREAPYPDPTRNVLALVEAAIARQDDLRNLEAAHMRELTNLRESYTRLLRDQESSRLDSIRQIDVNAVARAAEVSATQATTLAAQVATSAETLRGQVAAAAQASTVALSAALEPIQKSIDDLRRAQYEAAGSIAKGTESKAGNQWAVTFAVSAGLAILAVVGFIIANR